MGTVSEKSVRYLQKCPPPPTICASSEDVKKAVSVLSSSKKPLVIVGKGTYRLFSLINPLPRNKILDLESKAYAFDNIHVNLSNKKMKLLFER